MLTAHDVANLGLIVSDQHGDWFTAHLLRLIKKADARNREKLRLAFPEEVAALELWEKGTRMQWVEFVREYEEKENNS